MQFSFLSTETRIVRVGEAKNSHFARHAAEAALPAYTGFARVQWSWAGKTFWRTMHLNQGVENTKRVGPGWRREAANTAAIKRAGITLADLC